MNGYRNNKWIEFRNEVIELDGHVCSHCGRAKSEGAILQVHHNKYSRGLKPWEYPLEQCETVCKACHAGIHGKIKPRTGWEYLAEEDLGDLTGECNHCGSSLRYLFTIFHESWGCLEVGTICCDTLTESESASAYARAQKRREGRAKRFIESSRWKLDNDIFKIKQLGFPIEIHRSENQYMIVMNDIHGKAKYKTSTEAKLKIFQFIESGDAEKYFDEH